MSASIHQAWATSLDAVSTMLDATLADYRATLVRATSQELGATREQVVETAMQRTDLSSRKLAFNAFVLVEQHQPNPRSVWVRRRG